MIADLRTYAESLAREAAALLATFAGTVAAKGTKTSVTDVVTEADHASEALIVSRLQADRPQDGILAEEGSASTGSSGVRWVVDPLDGTVNFLYGLPVYGVSIGAELDGRPVAGAVVDAHGECFSAGEGLGATLDGRPIRASQLTDPERALVGTGFSYESDKRREQAEVAARMLPVVRDLRRAGAAAVDMCWVACGRLDGFYERFLKPWDTCAGKVIVAEAGGIWAQPGDITVAAGTAALADWIAGQASPAHD